MFEHHNDVVYDILDLKIIFLGTIISRKTW